MSIATDVKVKNLEILVNRLEREVSELKAKVDLLLNPDKSVKVKPWTIRNSPPS